MTEQLYSPGDVQKVREKLLKEQKGLDLLTGLEIPPKSACLDHSHQSQLIRGVLHRQSNACLGKLEGVYTRYLSYWYPHSLSTFLRQAADYLELEDDHRYWHPSALKKLQTMFNTCTEGSKRAILADLGQPEGGNGTERKKLFQSALKTKKFTFDEVKKLIQTEKENK